MKSKMLMVRLSGREKELLSTLVESYHRNSIRLNGPDKAYRFSEQEVVRSLIRTAGRTAEDLGLSS